MVVAAEAVAEAVAEEAAEEAAVEETKPSSCSSKPALSTPS